MMSYRNMILISLEEYQNLRKQLFYKDAPKLTQDLYKVKEYTENLPPDQQIALEGEVLRQHINQNSSAQQQPLSVVTSSPTPLDDNVIIANLNSFNRNNKVRANQIYQHLKAYKIQWNEMGQLLNQDNEPIPNSNIIELIDYVTNTNRNARMPAGFNEFLRLIEDSQLPRNYLSSAGITRAVDYKQLQAAEEESHEEQAMTGKRKSVWKTIRQRHKK